MDVDEDVHLIDYRTPLKGTTNKTEVIEIIDVTTYEKAPKSSKKRKSWNVYDKNLCKDNKHLTDFINKCIFLEQTSEMETIINKVLLPAYVKADMDYKQSEKFKRVVTKAFQRLLNNPDRKYNHINDVVVTLKIHVAKAPDKKKRVNLVTLSTKVTVKPNEINRKRPSIESSSRVSPKKSKPEVIALDDDDDDDVFSCDNDDECIPINDNVKEDMLYNQETSHKNNNTKDDLVNDETIEIQDSQEVKIIKESLPNQKERNNSISNCNVIKPIYDNQETELLNDNPTVDEINQEKENIGSSEHLNDGNMLLVPQKEKIVKLEKRKPKKKEPAGMTEQEKAKRIKVIEATIQKHNNTIAKLDLEEVTDDDANSPYYKCDRLRGLIVKLYKELCTLVGEEPPERRTIRLQISEGLPQGPIKRLEKFLNKQANEEGDTPFPDFSDVVRCVQKANQKDNLGWSKAKVLKEAQAIFSYCGRALQRRRQQREWKHLQAQVRPEEFDDDPAERDQALQTRLEANRQLAKKREAEVFHKFTRMETHPTATASTSLQIEEDPSEPDEDSSSDEEPNITAETTILKSPNDQTLTAETALKETNNDNLAETVDPAIVKEEPAEINIQYKGDISLVIETALKETNNDNLAETVDPSIVKEEPAEINIQYKGDISLVIETALKETNNNNLAETVDPSIVKEEPAEINIQYKGDISLVIEISDSESDDEVETVMDDFN